MERINNQITVVVGMSGGVDSSVAALLLKQQGFKVIGLHMQGENKQTAKEDQQRVQELCKKLDIELFVTEYKNEMQIVKDYFINEYLAGRTPNPCVVCNREVKFKPFIEFTEKLNAQYFATGHYAKIEHIDGKNILKVAKDKNKDQTYFLCQLSSKQLDKALFPLGELTKTEVRKIAEENGLISAQTKESYDVCFLGSQKFKDFMDSNYPEKAGNIIDVNSGKIVGKHTGISKYTLGQRKGLGIGGRNDGNGQSWFVSGKDVKSNTLYVTQGEGKELLSKELISGQVNWIMDKPNKTEFSCFAKFRYRQSDQKVIVKIIEDGKVKVVFDQPQRAVTPGQYVVFYDNDICLGGATIEKIIK